MLSVFDLLAIQVTVDASSFQAGYRSASYFSAAECDARFEVWAKKSLVERHEWVYGTGLFITFLCALLSKERLVGFISIPLYMSAALALDEFEKRFGLLGVDYDWNIVNSRRFRLERLAACQDRMAKRQDHDGYTAYSKNVQTLTSDKLEPGFNGPQRKEFVSKTCKLNGKTISRM